MKVSFDMNEAAYEVMERFAEEKDISVSEFIRRALLERLEDEKICSYNVVCCCISVCRWSE
ncbi:MAG: ribbon-helix-helix protein, CopG family [Selenomonadaceae bacterium]|nr:ribbon-helix-helix protein, CopG family [Selenomonadaceae bacterium]MBR1859065.1 ribbon-helix-helix protein, CopG family [Selenomonadaceae bacterium]